MQVLGLIDVNVDIDLHSILGGVLGGKQRRDLVGDVVNGLTGPKGDGRPSGKSIGSLPVVGPIINAPGGAKDHGAGSKTPGPKTPPPGAAADPEAIRRALVHQYAVQCGVSYRRHRDVQTTTVASYTECLYTCTTHAFAASAPGGARECLGASFARGGSGTCWYVVGAERATLEESYRAEDEGCDSFALAPY